jgi:hypothetical protein
VQAKVMVFRKGMVIFVTDFAVERLPYATLLFLARSTAIVA